MSRRELIIRAWKDPEYRRTVAINPCGPVITRFSPCPLPCWSEDEKSR
ncbi:hypothetical protein JRI60_47140 [Archangium violaceum]|nr:hypothetical protein [Archangium violaceum]QRN96499.1 hypothetical protein JRI60_47140 [Archangium violaceum]